ncbi:hypothetical protein K439DRAFT_1631520 [Ramaria rubella]|nr:hypothetical protein K439DRAFT_1631520 [Ramaria rubella]
MPSFFTSTSVSSNFAEQTSINPEPFQGATPPLLPAFLITGLLLAAIVFIIVWRHLIERRNAQQEDDPTWPLENTSGGHSSSKGPPPKLWDLKVMSESARATWESIMASRAP